jgi:hypothetical protein
MPSPVLPSHRRARRRACATSVRGAAAVGRERSGGGAAAARPVRRPRLAWPRRAAATRGASGATVAARLAWAWRAGTAWRDAGATPRICLAREHKSGWWWWKRGESTSQKRRAALACFFSCCPIHPGKPDPGWPRARPSTTTLAPAPGSWCGPASPSKACVLGCVRRRCLSSPSRRRSEKQVRFSVRPQFFFSAPAVGAGEVEGSPAIRRRRRCHTERAYGWATAEKTTPAAGRGGGRGTLCARKV